MASQGREPGVVMSSSGENNLLIYPGNSSVDLAQPYLNTYPNSVELAPRNYWSNNTDSYGCSTQHTGPVGSQENQDFYHYSPIVGDLFQPEEIFQLDQPLNQSKVHRPQPPAETLLDLESGTIQSRGSILVTSSELPTSSAPQPNDSQYFSYDSLHAESGRQTQELQYHHSSEKCPSQFPAPISYCGDVNEQWKGSDENGNHLGKSGRNSSAEEMHYRMHGTEYHNFGTAGCHENPQRIIYNSTVNAPNADHPAYYNQFSSYLPQGISTGICQDPNSFE